jgi:predicted enzyme related to lactoylglutathione lyase
MMDSAWLEIPVNDLARAKAFYETVFEHAPTEILVEGDRRITVIEGRPTVSLNQTPGFVPTEQGTLPYSHLEGPLADALARVTAAGGRVVEPATARAQTASCSAW